MVTVNSGNSEQQTYLSGMERSIWVHERTGVWTRMLRRVKLPEGFTVEAVDPIVSFPSSRPTPVVAILVLEDEDMPALQGYLNHRWGGTESGSGMMDQPRITLAKSSAICPTWRVLELGCVPFSTADLAFIQRLGAVVDRFYAQIESPTLSLEKRIWKNLPW